MNRRTVRLGLWLAGWLLILMPAIVLGQAEFGGGGMGGMGGGMMMAGGMASMGGGDFGGLGTPDVVDPDISEILADLRQREPQAKPHSKPQPVPETQVFGPQQTPATLNKRLSEPTNVAFKSATLADVVDWLKTELAVNVHVDRPAVEDLGLDPDQKEFNYSAKKISFRTALRRLLEPCELVAVARSDKLITITSAQVAEENLEFRVYPVQDLVRAGREAEGCRQLIRCVTQSIAPASWEHVGGPGSIVAFNGTLAVSSVPKVHRNIAALLRGIRHLNPKIDNIAAVSMASEAEQRVRGLLKKTVDAQFNDVPLSQAVAVLFDHRDAHVEFHHSLSELDVDPRDSKVTCDLRGLTLDETLALILAPLHMTHEVLGDSVMLMSDAAAESKTLTMVFDVTPLIDDRETSAHRPGSEAASLLSVLHSSIEPASWENLGGIGTLEYLTYRPDGKIVLIASNTRPLLAEVHQCLRMLLQAKQTRAQPREVPHVNDYVQRIYNLTPMYQKNAQAEQLMQHLSLSLRGPQNVLDHDERYIRLVGGKLIISHRRDVHRALAKLLNRLGAL